MDRDTRNAIERATQRARRLLEEDFISQLEGTYDVILTGKVAAAGGPHLSPRQRAVREKIVAAVEHKRAAGAKSGDAVAGYVRDAAFTALNRFVALKMLEARGLLQECVTRGELSGGFKEFGGLAPGIALLPNGAGYRLYVECLFDELSTEIKVLFDRRDPASALWPKRATFEDLLSVLNASELAGVWGEDETIGWVYQFFNSGDERRAMREESQAPRNSRELSVRNQFFTPRYVVRFLTENTLGRAWIEMMGDNTRLAGRCEFLVTGVESRGPRAKKDPRDIRILDPACGSGHFLLYAFDLFLQIYEEAWADPDAVPRAATGRKLRQDYPELDGLRRAVPGLILGENLHGVDIDPRCAQIAALALWLRAQRAFQEFGVTPTERLRITRTHIVVAEPMPGDAALVEAFAADLQPPLLGDLFRKMVAEMRLAGDLGSLIRVDKGIGKELGRARRQWNRDREPGDLLPGLDEYRVQAALDLSYIDDARFFEEAEALLLEALRTFAESASGGAGVRRRLFAGDAVQGIALIDTAGAHFDVVLMNPPFGACSVAAKKEFEETYPRTKNDLYAAFVERGVEMLDDRGFLGAITSRTGFFLSSFERWREEILLDTAPPIVFADLGIGVMDGAAVEAAAYCLERVAEAGAVQAKFLKLIGEDSKEEALLQLIKESHEGHPRRLFVIDNVRGFGALPGAPFAYWLSPSARKLFQTHEPFESAGRLVLQGPSTTDDFRFIRCWWEVAPGSIGRIWVPHAKGGSYSTVYADCDVLLNWAREGREVKAWNEQKYGGHWSRNIRNVEHYGKPALTFLRRTHRLAVRALPQGAVFSDALQAILVPRQELLAWLGFFQSVVVDYLVKARVGRTGQAVQFVPGMVGTTPVPDLPSEPLSTLARRMYAQTRSLHRGRESSHAFWLPPCLLIRAGSLADSAASCARSVVETQSALADTQSAIDESCFELYGLGSADRQVIIESQKAPGEAPDEALGNESSDEDSGELREDPPDPVALATDLISWFVGVAFGRFDVRLATRDCNTPPEPDPFDPLPVCSPGMLTSEAGLPLSAAPLGYPIAFPADGLLVDDPGHSRDFTAAVRAVFEVAFGTEAHARWGEAADLLDPNRNDLRAWLSGSFFEHHLKRYSKSRRKAPIVWQLATSSGSYSVWLYSHRVTSDTLFHLQNEFLAPKLLHEERRLDGLVADGGPNPSSAARKDIDRQEIFVGELRALRDEVARIAPLWSPDLNDGVVLSMAPLWRLVPQHRTWQKELRSAWDALASGEYDWAHVAMHLWPERVVPKCATDRSLAIAHGLEGVFWVEGSDGKWVARAKPTTALDELVRERSSMAVKAALQSLVEAPAAQGTTKPKRAKGAR